MSGPEHSSSSLPRSNFSTVLDAPQRQPQRQQARGVEKPPRMVVAVLSSLLLMVCLIVASVSTFSSAWPLKLTVQAQPPEHRLLRARGGGRGRGSRGRGGGSSSSTNNNNNGSGSSTGAFVGTTNAGRFNNNNNNNSDEDDEDDVEGWVVLIIFVVIVVAVSIGIVWCCYRRRKQEAMQHKFSSAVTATAIATQQAQASAPGSSDHQKPTVTTTPLAKQPRHYQQAYETARQAVWETKEDKDSTPTAAACILPMNGVYQGTYRDAQGNLQTVTTRLVCSKAAPSTTTTTTSGGEEGQQEQEPNQNNTIWTLSGSGQDVLGPFEIVEGYLCSTTGRAYWVEAAARRRVLTTGTFVVNDQNSSSTLLQSSWISNQSWGRTATPYLSFELVTPDDNRSSQYTTNTNTGTTNTIRTTTTSPPLLVPANTLPVSHPTGDNDPVETATTTTVVPSSSLVEHESSHHSHDQDDNDEDIVVMVGTPVVQE